MFLLKIDPIPFNNAEFVDRNRSFLTSMFRLTPRARAKALSRWCLVSGNRMVSVHMSGGRRLWVRRRFIGTGREINTHSLRNGLRAYFSALAHEPNQPTLSQSL